METIASSALQLSSHSPSHLMELAVELDRLESRDLNAGSAEEQLQLQLLRQAYRHEIELLEGRAAGRIAV